MVGNSMNSENMPWQYPQKSTNLGKGPHFAGLIRVYSGLLRVVSGWKPQKATQMRIILISFRVYRAIITHIEPKVKGFFFSFRGIFP